MNDPAGRVDNEGCRDEFVESVGQRRRLDAMEIDRFADKHGAPDMGCPSGAAAPRAPLLLWCRVAWAYRRLAPSRVNGAPEQLFRQSFDGLKSFTHVLEVRFKFAAETCLIAEVIEHHARIVPREPRQHSPTHLVHLSWVEAACGLHCVDKGPLMPLAREAKSQHDGRRPGPSTASHSACGHMASPPGLPRPRHLSPQQPCAQSSLVAVLLPGNFKHASPITDILG